MEFSFEYYKAFVPLFRLETYEAIVKIRKQLELPVYGVVHDDADFEKFQLNGAILLDLPPAKELLQGKEDVFGRLVDQLIEDYDLEKDNRLFIKLFILFDRFARPKGVIWPSIEYDVKSKVVSTTLKGKKNKENYLAIKVHSNVTKKEYDAAYEKVVLPFKSGNLKPRLHRSMSKDKFDLYYWIVLRKMRPSTYVRRFMKDSSVSATILQRDIGFTVRDMKKFVNSF